MGDPENRNLLLEIVNLIYDSVELKANSMAIFLFGQLSGFHGPRINGQRSNHPEEAAASGLGFDRLVFPDD